MGVGESRPCSTRTASGLHPLGGPPQRHSRLCPHSRGDDQRLEGVPRRAGLRNIRARSDADGSSAARACESPSVFCRCGSATTVIAVITDPREVREILRHPRGGAPHRPVKFCRSPPGLDPSSLNAFPTSLAVATVLPAEAESFSRDASLGSGGARVPTVTRSENLGCPDNPRGALACPPCRTWAPPRPAPAWSLWQIAGRPPRLSVP